MTEAVQTLPPVVTTWSDMEAQSRKGLVLVGALVLLVGVWGGVAPISSAVVAGGRVTLESSVKRIQHREGGIVSDILVHEGDRVQAGQVLVRLDATVANANEAIVAQQVWQLRARKLRLEAERDRRGVDAVTAGADAPEDYRRIIEAERRLMGSRIGLRAQHKAQLGEQIAQSEHEIAGLEAQVQSTMHQASLIQQELVNVRGLYQKGYAPFTRVSELQRQAEQLEGERGQLFASVARTHAQVAQIREQMLQVDSEALSEIMNDLKDTDTRLGQLEEQAITAHDASQRVEVRAPVTGKVQQMAVHTKGGVVAPGETMMVVVPESNELIVEARIDPQKIDDVHIGGRAHVRFTAFDTRTTPEAIGRVDTVSSDIETDEKAGVSFYRARLALDGMKVPSAVRQKLVSGMPVEVQIETGTRSALSYFLKPLSDQIGRTFREE